MLENFDFVYWVLVPVLICCTRVIDVSLGTLRIVFISRGQKVIAPMIGFVEIIVWLVAMTGIMQNLNNWVYFFAYAIGFSLGNYVGLLIEEKLAIGYMSVRVITRKNADDLIQALREKGFRLTTLDGMGVDGPVKLIYVIINRRNLDIVTAMVKEHNPLAFYSLDDVKSVSLDLTHGSPLAPGRKNNLILRRRKKEKM